MDGQTIDENEERTHNREFAAMLAGEYILIFYRYQHIAKPCPLITFKCKI
ncbi:MAG TPA: hypothetical protein PK275_00815 [Chitinophagaceae bacterium]|nr:hypothetical protein [Chitinophagaceae bacterium]